MPRETNTPVNANPAGGGVAAYDFFAPGKIVFGWGRRVELGALAKPLGQRAFLVVGSRTLEKSGEIDRLQANLQAAGVEPLQVATANLEPEVAHVDALSAKLKSLRPGPGDVVVAIGGGSAIDLAKAAAAMATNCEGDSVADYLEGVGRGLAITQPPLPLIALPATAGTGSEATKNAVISSYQPVYKKSLRSDLMVPRVVLVDPELTISVPPDVTAHTGMDAITQLIESYISRKAKPIPQALCVQGLKLALPALPAAVRDGSCRWAREAMSHAALLSGMALANSGLGLAHGVAAALGAECKIRHGLACAVMLPVALQVNREVRERELATLTRGCLDGAAQLSDKNAAEALIAAIEKMSRDIGIPARLSELGVRREQLPSLVAGSRGNSMAGNPRDVSDAELHSLLEQML